MNTENDNSEPETPVGSTALVGTDDPRVAFLREGKTDVLTSLLREIAEADEIGCSRSFFMLGMDPRFRKTEPDELVDLISGVLKERVPTVEVSHGAENL